MKLKKPNYIGLDHEQVSKKFEGDVSFVNYMNITDINGNNFVAAVYHAKSPNLEKGHKEYMLIRSYTDPVLLRSTLYVMGRTKEEIDKERIHTGLLCEECQTVLVSLYRHDYHGCECENSAFVDGGKDYFRAGAKSLAKTQTVEVDLLTDEIKVIDGKQRK